MRSSSKKKDKATNIIEYTQEQYTEALYDVDDLLSRFGYPFLLLDQTAKAAKESEYMEGGVVTVGFRSAELTRERLDSIKMIKPDIKASKKELTYVHPNGIEVVIKLIDKNYDFIKYYDQIVFRHWNFAIPGNFEKYWKVRGIIA